MIASLRWLTAGMALAVLLSLSGCVTTAPARLGMTSPPQPQGPLRRIDLEPGFTALPPYPGISREFATVHDACAQGFQQFGRMWMTDSREAVVAEAARRGAQAVSLAQWGREWDVMLLTPGQQTCPTTYTEYFCHRLPAASDGRFEGGCTLANAKAYQAMGFNLCYGGKYSYAKLCEMFLWASFYIKTGSEYTPAIKQQTDDYLAIFRLLLDAGCNPNQECPIRTRSGPLLKAINLAREENTMFWDMTEMARADQLKWKDHQPTVGQELTTEQVQAYLNEMAHLLIAAGAK